MTLLERFRAQPRQKHTDPAVRLAFVQEIPITEREALAEMAREDADVRVRRAAVGKLLDPGALAAIAAHDADESVREQATAMLRDIALESFEGVAEAESLAAVDALTDTRALAAVAKGAASEAAAMRACGRIGDAHVLGSIARHAEHEGVRRAAFEALQDDREVLGVALHSEFREPATTAVDRIADRRDLDQIAARARNKSASKRARAILREIEERETRERDEAAAAAAAAAEAERAARADAEARLEGAARDEAERQAALDREARERATAERAAANAAADAERAREAEAHDRERQEAAEHEAARARVRLDELADEAARLAAAEEAQGSRRQFGVIRREWADLVGRAAPDENAAAKYAAAEAAFAVREQAAREADQKARRDALARLQQLAARVEPLAAREDLTLKAGERALRDVRAALGSMPPLPTRQDYDEMMQRLKAAQAALTPKVQELREVAGWQRWANVGIQEQLVEKMEALKALDDAEQVARQVKELQEQWRQAADVPRAQGEALWRRFKTAHDEVWAKCEAHFAAQAVARAENLARKVALCERAEALADSTNWIQTAEAIKALQAEWKSIGPVSRGQEKSVWERFRSACDRFFTRRHADLVQRKAHWAENLAAKEALIVRVEALANSTDWEPAAAEIKRIQNEWKTIGPVKKSRSEALWQRFRAACDLFFSRYAQRHDIARGERVAAREAIVAELEALAAGEQPPDDVTAKIRAIRGRWSQELAARGVDRERAAALDERFQSAFSRITQQWPSAFAGTELDPDANRKRMESIVKRMEDLAASLAGPAPADESASPTTRLAAMLKEALAANTIGGKADMDSRFRAATEEVRHAQANWSRIGPVPDDTRRALADRFQRAIKRIGERVQGSKVKV
jgi:uncharacterized protein DUF349